MVLVLDEKARAQLAMVLRDQSKWTDHGSLLQVDMVTSWGDVYRCTAAVSSRGFVSVLVEKASKAQAAVIRDLVLIRDGLLPVHIETDERGVWAIYALPE